MAKRIMFAEGFDGQVELLSDRVVIHRGGLLNAMKYGMSAKREIPLSAISEIVFKPPIMMGMGQIEFVRGGRSLDEKKSANNSVVKFTKKKFQEFEMLKEKTFELMDQYAKANR